MIALLAAVDAERIKLTTTSVPRWAALVVAVAGVAVALLRGAAGGAVTAEEALVGVAVIGIPVLVVVAATTVTGEYRSGMIRATFAAQPRRALVLLAKAIVAAVFAAVVTAAAGLVTMLVARLVADPVPGAGVSPASAGTWTALAALTGTSAVAAVLGVAVGALLRSSAGAVAVLLLWPLVVEPTLAYLPDVGPALGPYLPFANAFAFAGVPWPIGAFDAPWGRAGSLVYFAVVAAAGLAVASVRTARRDA